MGQGSEGLGSADLGEVGRRGSETLSKEVNNNNNDNN